MMRYGGLIMSCFLFMWSLPDVFGAALEYSSYFGGPFIDGAFATAVDADGNIYMAGRTDSTNSFPLTNAVQEVIGGKMDVCVSKMDRNGRILFSTYLGGSGDEEANTIALS